MPIKAGSLTLMLKNSYLLYLSWQVGSRALDDVHAQAVNASANDAWFDLVEEVQLHGDDGKPIAPECTWGMDETGFQPNGSEGYEYVIGGTGQKLHVLVTIGADWTALKPLIIYAGKGQIRLAHSPKGWTDKAITVEYAIDFDQQTRDIAAGRTPERIKVPCYMPHATHVYQGLDVVCFSPVKKWYGKKRDALLRDSGQHITKENFLMVYGEVHLEVLTPELIKEAFRKTGIVPFDRSVITKEKLAPSKESSYQVITPVIPPTPVCVVSEYLLDVFLNI
ncbi:hypothetical protein BJ165DRAFT_1604721 [Panaeolus papilionaceus]|nr:hypothetical protein BJ165DRAFT_1604721 [Panaeolus papilionaceus]